MIEQAQKAIALQESGEKAWEKYDTLWKEVRRKHPRIFTDNDLGTGVGAGWWTLLDEAFTKIDAVLDENPSAKLHIVQIKEKFGGLRVYCSFDGPEDVNQLIDTIIQGAETQAGTTCEVCGEPGEGRYGGWIKVLCDKHAQEREKR